MKKKLLVKINGESKRMLKRSAVVVVHSARNAQDDHHQKQRRPREDSGQITAANKLMVVCTEYHREKSVLFFRIKRAEACKRVGYRVGFVPSSTCLREYHERSHAELPGLLHFLQHVRQAMPQAPGHGLDLHLKVLPAVVSGRAVAG